MFTHHHTRQRKFLRWFKITSVLAFALTLTACGGRFSFPGLEPTVQPVAVVADQFAPTITLSPPSGYAGIYVQVTGAGWPPNMIVVVVLSDPSGISTTVTTKDTDSVGNLSTGFLYPVDARWLLTGAYTVAAASADGQYQASAQFTVSEPGTEVEPTAVATPAVAAAPTAINTVVPTVAQPTATTASATSTPAPASTPTPRPVAEHSPTPQASAAEATPSNSNQPPVVKAAFNPTEERQRTRAQYVVEASASDPDDNLNEVVAILLFPPLEPIEDVKLKVKDKIEIKVDRGRVEISAPDPQALLDSIQQQGGIEVQPGQRIEYKISPDHKYKAEFGQDKLVIEASTLLLQVTAVDAAGLSHQVTASPPALSDEGNDRRDGDDDDDNSEDNDRGGDDD